MSASIYNLTHGSEHGEIHDVDYSTSIYGLSHGSEHREIYDIDYSTSIYGLSHGSQHGQIYDVDYRQYFHRWPISLIITWRYDVCNTCVTTLKMNAEE